MSSVRNLRIFRWEILFILVYCRCVTLTWCLPFGAPRSACDNMTPEHGEEAPKPSPFTLTVSRSTYSPSTPITVTIGGGSHFSGFLLQARRKNSGAIVGTYSLPSTQKSNARLVTCDSANDAVTHRDTKKKSNLQLTWHPPEGDEDDDDISGGELEFVATIAQTKETWWSNVKSETLTPEN